MNDNLLYTGKDFVVLDSNGLNYKKNVTRRKMILGMYALLTLGTIVLSGMGFVASYNIGIQSPASLFMGLGSMLLVAIGGAFGTVAASAYDKWITAESRYNLAMSRNQSAILKAKEEMAQHEQNIKNIQYEKEVTFHTPMERAFTKNG